MRTKAKTKSVAYWLNSVVGQRKQFPVTPEEEANYDVALLLVNGRNIEKMEAA
jgi:hypothetical protein